MRRLGRILLLLAALVAAVPAVADEGDPPGRVGRVAQVSGTVRMVAEDGNWVVLPLNRPLTTGDRVVTESDGRATIQVGSSTFRIGPDTDVDFERLDDDFVRLHFDHGELALRVRSAAVLGEISVQADEGRFVPHHVGAFRFDRPPGGTLAAMAWSGDLLLEAHDSSLPIEADQRAEIWQEGPSQVTHYRLVAIPSDDFSDWVLSQDKADDRAAAAGAPSLPAEMTGAADLSQYGRWSSSSDYGTIWTPNDVPAGWAPYQNGSWSWIAPWGWTWMDAAPWGFAPFHYGRWIWLNGHWVWLVGSWGPRPVYAPGLVGWIGGPGFTIDGAPAVGWVPLAWNEPFFPPYWCSSVYWVLVNGPVPPPPSPPRKGIEPVRSRPLGVPSGQANYANRNAPGGVTIMPVSGMAQRPPANGLRSPAISRLTADVVAGTAHKVAEPAPPVGRLPAGLGGARGGAGARESGSGSPPAGHVAPAPGNAGPSANPGGAASPGRSPGPAAPSGRSGGRSAALLTPQHAAPPAPRPVRSPDAPVETATAPESTRLRMLVSPAAVASGPVRVSRVAPAPPEAPAPASLPGAATAGHTAGAFMPASPGVPAPGAAVVVHTTGGMSPRGGHQ